MCGILAIISDQPGLDYAFDRAMKKLIKRGPDAEGEWLDDGIKLGHRRLAIIDLDERSVQPMHSLCGRYVIVFNGEIYNFLQLKAQLLSKGVSFRTESDTEVLLNLYIMYREKMLLMLEGMFSFVIWDKVNQEAFVARDPYGIKPLYFAVIDGGVIISSTISAVLASRLVDCKKSIYGQKGFYLLGSIPEPHTWFENISAVKSGSYFFVSNNLITKCHEYADINKSWTQSSKYQNVVSYDLLLKQVKYAVEESIDRHLVSDVPVGLFLSGGIDSGVLAGLMAKRNNINFIGITLKFSEFVNSKIDETERAINIANLYGIEHHIRVVSKEEFLKDLPLIMDDMDQPSIDGINTWYASKAASELGLKVVLSGVGGDELFFGYDSFVQLPPLVNIWSKISKIKIFYLVAKILSHGLAVYFKNKRWLEFPNNLKTLKGAYVLKRGVLATSDITEILEISSENFSSLNFIEEHSTNPNKNLKLHLAQLESTLYLRNQLLRDSDWASMAHSIELRTPFVDYRLLKSLEKLFFNLSNYKNKIILSDILTVPLPDDIKKAKKTGFGIPIKNWIGKTQESNYNFNRYWMQEIVKGYEQKCKKLAFELNE